MTSNDIVKLIDVGLQELKDRNNIEECECYVMHINNVKTFYKKNKDIVADALMIIRDMKRASDLKVMITKEMVSLREYNIMPNKWHVRN